MHPQQISAAGKPKGLAGWRLRHGFQQFLLVALAALAFAVAVQAQAPQSAPNPAFDQLVAQASAARANGDMVQASSFYTQALALNPAWPDGWWYLGQIHYSANEYAQAIDAFTHYLDLVPNAAPATALRGLCEFELGEFDPSLRDVQRALALGAADDSRNTQILRYHEALLLTRLGRFEEALTAYTYFGKQHLASDDIDVAIGLAMLRLPLMPADASPSQHDAAAAAGNAAFLFMSGDTQGAAQAFQQFFAADPTAANVHYSYGYLLYPTDQDAAIAEFRREAAINPGSAIDHTMLAWSLLMENQPAEALPEAKKAAAAAPSLTLAQLSLGRALLETGDAKAATPILESALALEPGNLEVHLALARAYSETGRETDARRERLACLQMTEHSTKTAPAMGQQEEPPAK
jgi:tetratricopeptide (TPR) repeat protein